MQPINKKFGLIGKNIHYSFSKEYFTDKFSSENLENCSYENFDIQDIFEFTKVAKIDSLVGVNVTIPYKETIIPFLDSISKKATKIGAINTIVFESDAKTRGYNTDWYGFKKAIKKNLKPHHKKALILGTGGSSKAVAFAFSKLKIEFAFVSRTGHKNGFLYADLNKDILASHQIIVNCTPIGTSPDIDLCPDIPYEYLNESHLVFDLIYNPEKTMLLQKAEEKRATIQNGFEMLVYQAEKAWEIWNRK